MNKIGQGYYYDVYDLGNGESSKREQTTARDLKNYWTGTVKRHVQKYAYFLLIQNMHGMPGANSNAPSKQAH